MKDEAEEESAIAGARYEVRKKYQEYALPIIQETHADTGCFSGSTGSKENWISGFYGISGCGVIFVANFDGVRVEVHISANDKAFNKMVFDKLYTYKESIESELGVTLLWDRGEDKKSSKIYYELKGLSINDEIDWPRMAKFHAEWSKKMYDAVVKHILEMT